MERTEAENFLLREAPVVPECGVVAGVVSVVVAVSALSLELPLGLAVLLVEEGGEDSAPMYG